MTDQTFEPEVTELPATDPNAPQFTQPDWEQVADPQKLRLRIYELESRLTTLPENWGGEAPALAWTKLYTPQGAEITLSVRAMDAQASIDELVRAVKYGYTQYRLTTRPTQGVYTPAQPTAHAAPQPTSPAASYPAPGAATPPQAAAAQAAAPAPTQPPAAAGAPATGLEELDVRSVHHGLSRNNQHILIVKGGRYSKHGLPVYPEYIPPAIKQVFESWPLNTEFQAPDGMKKVTTDGKKVVACR